MVDDVAGRNIDSSNRAVCSTIAPPSVAARLELVADGPQRGAALGDVLIALLAERPGAVDHTENPRPCSVSATTTWTGFAVAQKTLQTSGTSLSSTALMKCAWPAG